MKKLLLIAAACAALSSLALIAMNTEQTFKEDSEPVTTTNASVEADEESASVVEPTPEPTRKPLGSDPRTYTPKWLLDGTKYQGGKPRHGGVIVGPIPTDATTENNE